MGLNLRVFDRRRSVSELKEAVKMKKLAFVALVAMAGCASTNANLQRETARSIGNTMDEDVTVSDVDRSATSVKWNAQTKDATYRCSADDMVRRVNCVKR